MVHGEQRLLKALLLRLYSAVGAPELWGEFLQDLTQASGAIGAVLISHDQNNSDHKIVALSGAGLRDSVALYEQLYFKFDEWTLRFPIDATHSGRIVLGEEIWPNVAFRQSVFYNDFLTRFDICQMACVAEGDEPGLFDALSLFRGPRQDSFGEELTILQSIAPHLRTALGIRRKLAALETRAATFENALDRLGSAMIFVDALGAVLFANASAQQILATGGLLIRNGRLTAENTSESAQLRELVRRATGGAMDDSGPTSGSMSVRRSHAEPLHILVSPFLTEGGFLCRSAAATIYISDPGRLRALPDAVLRQLFRLTRAESRLALEIFAGNNLNEAAGLNHVSRETVKSQLQSIFRKTGTRRQSELIRLLASLSCFQIEGLSKSEIGNLP